MSQERSKIRESHSAPDQFHTLPRIVARMDPGVTDKPILKPTVFFDTQAAVRLKTVA